MNKKDIILCIIVLLTSAVIYLLFNILETTNNKTAVVYYDNKIILKIDLNNTNKQEYEVEGLNGKIKIESQEGKVRVIEENSPKHLCSKQGYISKGYETIICLPNKIVIKIEDSTEIDTIAR